MASSLVFLVVAAAPALAGDFGAVLAPRNGLVLERADACAHQQALDLLGRADMRLVAEVPRTKALYRFVVDWKSDLFAVTIAASNCHLDVVDYARRIKPYCNYVPGLISSCPLDEMLAQ
jgi:hypothetical protein